MGLSITSCKNLKCIAGIETLQNLYEIDFSDCSELEDISIIKNFPNLRSLNLSGCKKLKVKPDKLILETQIEIDTFKSKL
jgi:Leucine-rich repeat (LRR) protein